MTSLYCILAKTWLPCEPKHSMRHLQNKKSELHDILILNLHAAFFLSGKEKAGAGSRLPPRTQEWWWGGQSQEANGLSVPQ